MRRVLCSVSLFLICMLVPSTGQAQQTLSLYVGGFAPRGFDARSDGDALFNNRFNGNYSLDFDLNDFRGATIGAEWLVGIGDHLEAGLGVGRYGKTVHSTYAFLVEDDGGEIEQDLRLRMVPFTATLRVLPFGRGTAVEPYFGAGVGVFAWRYSEIGRFVDVFDDTVFGPTRFVGSGSAAGPVVLGGIRFPFGAWSLGGEVRYQSATGDLPRDEFLRPIFLGDVIDLGGFNYLMTFNVHF